MEIRLKRRESLPRPAELRLPLSGELLADLDLYRQLYANHYEEELTREQLVEEIVRQFLRSDRSLRRHKRASRPGTER